MNIGKQTKSKPITTSVPSFAIRFHASGEELEELYPSEEEEKSEKSVTEEKCPESSTAAAGDTSKHESSPMRDYLNKFGKRSSSIDTGINETSTLGPHAATSDPWRIFSEFKGKITKTVEEKLSEIKSKSSEGENSPKHTNKGDKSKISNSKENSSVSDSEEQSFSECSIPKSGGLSSTAEDIEMSSDDENSLADNEKTPTENDNKEFGDTCATKKHTLRRRIKSKPFVQFSTSKDTDVESLVKISSLSTVHEKEGPSTEDEVESGVEAYEDFTSSPVTVPDELEQCITLIAPSGFVDMRRHGTKSSSASAGSSFYRYRTVWIVLIVFVLLCFVLPMPTFVLGFIVGILVATAVCVAYYYLNIKTSIETNVNTQYFNGQVQIKPEMPILEIPAAKEYQPVTKFEGWINEYPEQYDPATYHIAKTQSVFLKLEGSILRISHTRSKIPKRAMWNEPKHKVVFTQHRIYSLRGSQVMLLPSGLIHKRLWSKKYPICIILNKEKMNLDLNSSKKIKEEENENEDEKKSTEKSTTDSSIITKDNETYADPLPDNLENSTQLDNICTEDEKDIFTESFSDAAMIDDDRDEISINAEDWDTLTLDDTSVETKIYLFARTCRDKEDWYRRLVVASHDDTPEVAKQNDEETHTTDADTTPSPDTATDSPQVPDTTASKQQLDNEIDYLRYMARYNQVKTYRPTSPSTSYKRNKLFRKKKDTNLDKEDDKDADNDNSSNNTWVNALIARILYDVFKHDTIVGKMQHLIQRKLSTIKLPYFIEDIVISDLSFGKSAPVIHRITTPSMDERGLWVYMDLTYEGLISMALVTKLNLMKLKQQAGKIDDSSTGCPSYISDTRSPIFHSDVEDSAESSSDEESTWMLASSDASQDSATAKANTGGKKFLRMVDKIAASKYFQQATDNKYIKRAMEGVSKTEFKLTVEIQYLEGTLALNIPPPPSDRVWLGFRGNPKLQLSAHPTFGERSLNFMHVTRWIEKKLSIEFQKFLVLPNMEDFVLPVMNPMLPQ